MTKNRDRYPLGEQSLIENNQTVVVLDEHGEVIGKTYPKRAKGLIKKGRAEFLSENVIRIKNSCPTEKSEESIMEINEKVINNQSNEAVERAVETELKTPERKHEYIFFKPRDWYANPDTAHSNSCERSFYQFPDGKFEEIYILGEWWNRYSEIRSNVIPLDGDTDYTFVFWLNGGENDRANEICRCLVIYLSDDQPVKFGNDDWNNRYVYNLVRGRTRYLKTVDGWYLFAIDLPKTDKHFLELRFNANNAPMALREAAAPESYADIPDSPDEFAGYRPQRHNIAFPNGWPDDREYSTAAIKARLEAESRGETVETRKPEPEKKSGSGWDNLAKLVAENIDLDEIASNIDTSDIADYIDLDDIADNIDLDDIVSNIDLDDIADNIDMDELAESVTDKLDLDDLADKIAERLDIRSIIEDILND